MVEVMPDYVISNTPFEMAVMPRSLGLSIVIEGIRIMIANSET